MQNNYTKYEHLTQYAELLKANGFTIILPEEPGTWFHFAKDNRIGYVQADKWGRFAFSTKHKPSRENGTGFGVYEHLYNPTVAHAETTLQRPSWANRYRVKTYASVDEFIQSQKWNKPYILQ